MQHFNQSEKPFKDGDSGPKYLWQGGDCEWGLLLLKPGQGSRVYGRHYHQVVTESFYLVSGQCHFWIDGQEFDAVAGDVVTIEPGEKHWLENAFDQNCEAIFIKTPFDPSDRTAF